MSTSLPPIHNTRPELAPIVFFATRSIPSSLARLLVHCLTQYGPTRVDSNTITVGGIRSLDHRLTIVRHLRALSSSLGIESRIPLQSSARHQAR